MERETKKEFNNLGRMIQKGFDHVDKKFEGVDKKISSLQTEMNFRFDEVDGKLNNVAYRFELQDLEKRVEKVELKLGLRKN